LTGPVIVPEPEPALAPPPIEQLPAWALTPQPANHSRIPFVLTFAGVALALVVLIRIITQ